MTMMIIKFHRLIQNKFVWIVFSALVVISFVFWGMQQPDADAMREAQSPATLNGKPVSAEEFYNAEFGSYFRLLLQSGQQIPMTAEIRERLAPIAWKRLVSLKEANRLGLVANDEEVRSGLEGTGFLSPNGTFDPEQYDRFINQALPSLLGGRISKPQFEDHVRQEISLDKLARMVAQTVLVAPHDLDRVFHTLNDEYEIEYTLVRSDDVEDGIEITEEDQRAYFEDNIRSFEIPERISIQYVALDVEAYLDGVTIRDETVEAYYADNQEQFQIIETNEVAVTLDGGTNEDFSAGAAITYQPFEDVRDDIVAKLKRDKARLIAVEVANDLVYALTPDQFGRAPTFEEATASLSLEARDVDPFTATQPVIDAFGDDSTLVQEQAFALYPNPDEFFSNPVDAGDTIYVLALKERLPPYLPEYENVAEDVKPFARRQAVARAMEELARSLKEAAEAADPGPTAFADAAAGLGLTTTNIGPFSARSGFEEIPSAEQVLQTLNGLNQGEISDPILTERGLMVARVRARIEATDETFELSREQLIEEMRQQYTRALFDGWQDQLLRDADFTERQNEADDTEVDASPTDPDLSADTEETAAAQ